MNTDIGFLRLLISRLLKPAVLATVTYLSLRILGFTHSQSLFASLVPLLTGATNVFASLGYLLVVVVLITAVGSALFPSAKQDLQRVLAGRQNQQEISQTPSAQQIAAPDRKH